MKKTVLTAIAIVLTVAAFSQDEQADREYQQKVDSLEMFFAFQHDTIVLSNGVGKIIVPKGFKYLNQAQAETVLVDIWGNPKRENMTLGFLLPEEHKILSDDGYVFNILYDEIGFVKDDDAGDINYDDLLKQMQKDMEEENKEREKGGYQKIAIIGWAEKPFYDEKRKILHWAKELKDLAEEEEEANTLNYNINVLGRKGVLILNAIAKMPHLPMVQNDIDKVLTVVQFDDGYKYKDFDPSVDQVAVWTIGGLVAGKILAKVGFFALILKFWKLIAIALLGFFGALWKKMRGAKEES